VVCSPCLLRLTRVLALQVATTFISCPADAAESLGIKMPYLVLIVKNLRRFFSFEVQARRGGQLEPRRSAPHPPPRVRRRNDR